MPICPTALPPFIMQSLSILNSPANGLKFICRKEVVVNVIKAIAYSNYIVLNP